MPSRFTITRFTITITSVLLAAGQCLYGDPGPCPMPACRHVACRVGPWCEPIVQHRAIPNPLTDPSFVTTKETSTEQLSAMRPGHCRLLQMRAVWLRLFLAVQAGA